MAISRKTFIKTSSAIAAGALFSPLLSCQQGGTKSARTNWAGNYRYLAPELHKPRNADEVIALVRGTGRFKALGSCHCFNDIADSSMSQISTELLTGVEWDETNKTVTVGAGVRYGQLAPQLEARGFALHNLASLPHISVAGACATATHGSGVGNGNLATGVSAIEIVTGTGELKRLTRDDGDFYGAVVGLGALGVVTRMTLQLQPRFDVAQFVYQDLPLESLKENFRAIMSAGYSVSLFTDWLDGKVSQVWIKQKVEQGTADPGPSFYGATRATRNLHPIVALSAENCTEQLGVPGPWYERLPHFKMGFTPSSGEELQAEYFVPIENGLDAILALEKKKDIINPQLMISEIRTVAADELWMSPAYQQDVLAIHFTLKQNIEGVGNLLPQLEAELAPFGVRPHWGKLFTIDSPTLRSRYPRFDDFVKLAGQMDPERKFGNDYLERNIFA